VCQGLCKHTGHRQGGQVKLSSLSQDSVDMKGLLLLPLLLLGTVSALHLENDAPHQGRGETQADLRQDLEGSGDQERELALNDEVPESEEEARAPGSQDAFVDEEAMESDQAALDENVECPREEDSVQMQASTGGVSHFYLLVRSPRTFKEAQNVCSRCYRGNLNAICLRNQAQNRCRRFQWSDGSCWNFQYWAPGHPRNGRGRCVSMTARGGRWRLISCLKSLPFVCSI
uniref:Proteoglycan 3 n=1 Tax=Sus scrofa TaxID=9823 RepID=A0A4X1VK32_PIG